MFSVTSHFPQPQASGFVSLAAALPLEIELGEPEDPMCRLVQVDTGGVVRPESMIRFGKQAWKV